MTMLTWNAVGSRFYEAGLDRGVLYLDGQVGIPWSGLTGVSESPSGGDPKPFYLDGMKYLNLSAVEEFEATITAFTYPVEFSVCDGSGRARPSLFLGQQRRTSFGLCYRTKVGNDIEGTDYGYKLHLVYNALAQPSERSFGTLGGNTDVADFSWKITTKAIAFPGYNPTSHLVIDSRFVDPSIISKVEDALYGSDSINAHLPDFTELLGLLDDPLAFSVTDNGDGTYTVEAPSTYISIDTNIGFYSLTWPTAVDNGDNTITISD